MSRLTTLVAASLVLMACEQTKSSPPPVNTGLQWVALPAGEFEMGSMPEDRHQVTVPAFEMTRAEITVAQYLTCVDAGGCSPIRWIVLNSNGCNWSHPDRGDHPVNCIRKQDAIEYADWIGGRLPTEAQWEYAARSAGLRQPYPWGHQGADCEYAVMSEHDDQLEEEEGLVGIEGCGENRTWPVCSKPAGNSEQGLCDLIGNVNEWVLDDYCSYEETPRDGSSASCDSNQVVLRGGDWTDQFSKVSAYHRDRRLKEGLEASRGQYNGVRVVRDL